MAILGNSLLVCLANGNVLESTVSASGLWPPEGALDFGSTALDGTGAMEGGAWLGGGLSDDVSLGVSLSAEDFC